MFEYFLTNKELKKIELYKYILFSKEGKTKKEIILAFPEINQSTGTRYLKELIEDLFSCTYGEVILKEAFSGKFYVAFNEETTYTADFTIDQLRYFYIEKNQLFLLLRTLVNSNFETIEQLSQETNMSMPNLYRSLAVLNTILKNFDVKICLEDPSNFTGNEFGIRYFFYLVYGGIFRTTTDTPFRKNFPTELLTIEKLKEQLDISKELSKSQENRVRLIYGISAWRMLYRKKSLNVDEKMLEDIQFFYNGKPLLHSEYSLKSRKILENESIMLSFFIQGLIYEVYSFEQRKKIVEKYCASKLTISKQAEYILFELSHLFEFCYTDKNYIESYYLLILGLIFQKHLNLIVDPIYENSLTKNRQVFEKNQLLKESLPKLEKFLAQYIDFSNKDEIEKDYILFFYYQIINLNKAVQPINIFIENTNNIIHAYTIKNKLLNVFNPTLLNFVTEPSKAYLLISNTYEGHFPNSERFYFNNIYDSKNWQTLFHFISTKIYSKL
ncbi:helix-turn-helix domain-containing protein [Enterococcus hermanniensis]|uniref:Mga helix-turn-helix domain-containing protein n=1 Tax=Enterococcus hermanniensis TaxID=249189 RepID=A0A1L8TPJ7_9ENTE|nr:helix-turn-helix domain-containing protein [Enterococcus hermanniensis]OJG46255.1 hypothetical protein RV04_GL001421 [Enterococcus hermanniensis]